MPNNPLIIRPKAFKDCFRDACNIDFKNVNHIYNYGFENCGFENLTLYECILDENAFYKYPYLKRVEILPEQKIYINENVFNGCNNLEEININNPKFFNDSFLNKYKDIIKNKISLDELINESKTFKEINNIFKEEFR